MSIWIVRVVGGDGVSVARSLEDAVRFAQMLGVQTTITKSTMIGFKG